MNTKPRMSDYSKNPVEYAAALAHWAQTPEGKAEEIAVQRRRDMLARDEETERAREAEDRIVAMGVPAKDLALIKAQKIETTEAVEALAMGGKPLVVISGNPGCGKTTAASNWLVTTPGPGLFVKAAAMSRWDCYDNEEMDRLLKAPKLVIDDLGLEFMDRHGRFLSVLTEVIDVRYDASLPMVITTWLPPDDFKARYGERIADRLRESGRFAVVASVSRRGSKR